MKLLQLFVFGAIGCALACGQQTEGPESRQDGAAIKAQIKNLDSDSFDARTKAMDELRAAGESARSALEGARKSESLETRTRAETLLKELDDRKATPRKGAPRAGVRPLAPDDEQTAEPRSPERAAPPRLDEFQDPQAYVEALRKWIEKDSRFPRFVLPDGRDLGQDFGQDFKILTPDLVTGGNSVSITHSGGETRTFTQGPDGVTLKVERRDETGKPTVETWTAKSVEELKEKHPDVWEKYHPTDQGSVTRSWTIGGQGPDLRPNRKLITPGVPMPLTPTLDANQPVLGVMPSAVPGILDKHLKLNGEGMVIDSVSPDSLASRLGILDSDVLVRLDGEVIRERGDIARALRKKDPPATVTARVIREGAVVELTAPREKTR
jgi:hypothetical protein